MKILLSITLCLIIGCATAAKFIDEDTIIIDNNIEKVKREVIYEDTIVRTSECKTTRGDSGHCKDIRECYPVLFSIDKNATITDVTLNNGLAEILIQVAGFCDLPTTRSKESFEKVLRSEILICCPNSASDGQPPLPLPPSKPIVVAEQDKTLEEIGKGLRSCGLKADKIQLNSTNKLNNEATEDDDRIVQGHVAQKGQFPWIVALMDGSRQFCGGSLISNQWIVTAAHCVQHMGGSEVANLRILLGAHNIYAAESTQQTRSAISVLYHKGFSMQHLHHDIGMIKLSSPVTYTPYVQPVILHSGSPSVDNVQGDIAGWGQLRDNGPQPQDLRTASVCIWPHADCKQKYGSDAPAGIGNGMLCSGGTGPGTGTGPDSCRGDSGGPLTINSKNKGSAQLVGLVSFGIGCGSSHPGVYTRVEKYLSWINKNKDRR